MKKIAIVGALVVALAFGGAPGAKASTNHDLVGFNVVNTSGVSLTINWNNTAGTGWGVLFGTFPFVVSCMQEVHWTPTLHEFFMTIDSVAPPGRTLGLHVIVDGPNTNDSFAWGAPIPGPCNALLVTSPVTSWTVPFTI